jgi:hypothetical protein
MKEFNQLVRGIFAEWCSLELAPGAQPEVIEQNTKWRMM